MRRELWVVNLGTLPYAEALQLQRAAARARISGDLAEDVLILVEHPPVVTLGRSAREKNLLTSTEFLAARGVELYEVERGGDVTFHGPGQLVGYPIVNLRQHKQDLHWYLRTLEGILIGGLRTLGLEAESREKLTGVWTNGRKIASIGVHARDWVTWHGFALNVNTDLSFFDLIVPCGIDGVVMTSVARELNVAVADPAAAADAMVESSASALDLRPCAVTAASLRDIVSAGQQNGAGSASAA